MKETIENEMNVVLHFARLTCEKQQTTYIQSWWLNRRNCPELDMDTPTINRRLKRLVKLGVIHLDQSHTSTSKGTSYIIIGKERKDLKYENYKSSHRRRNL